MTFLDLCQSTALESGTISSGPNSVLNQTGRLRKIVHWVRSAWERIQTERSDWHFLDGFFEGDHIETISNNSQYSFKTWNIDDFGSFRVGGRDLSIYDPAIGKSEEEYLPAIPWSVFQSMYRFGDVPIGKPQHYSIGPNGQIFFGPTPDKNYRVRGRYLLEPQILRVDDDEPKAPKQFHTIIMWYALILLNEHDEGFPLVAAAQTHYRNLLSELVADQTPRMTFGPALV